MNRQMRSMFILLCASLLLQGCAAKKEVVKLPPQPLKTLTAAGYGTAVDKQLQPAQRRLMGMRASKMDAYRDMAEQIYGVNLNGRTTVEHMVVKNDDYRTFVDTIVRGARVKSIKAIDVDTYETVLEYDLTPKFFECLNAAPAALNECIKSTQGFTVSLAPPQPVAVAAPPAKSGHFDCNSDDCYHYPQVKGFGRPKSRPNYLVDMLQEISKSVSTTSSQLYQSVAGKPKGRHL